MAFFARIHRRAFALGNVVCMQSAGYPYHRLEKVKFGVSLEEVCKNDIPGPLLVLILKLNKEAPLRKDVFRAPGNQGAMKKLIHFLQQGRLVNVDNYSVYTIASVLKKFLRKIPGGIFGIAGEAELFNIVEIEDEKVQQDRIHNLLMSLPVYTQRLLVLLFGTFRVIASNAERAATGMTSEALGVSVAPSFFQSCVSDGKTARMEDVLRFKVATRIMKQMIEQFAAFDLFGRENYEYYARVTGRVLRVQDEWICSFRFPNVGKSAQQHYALTLALETEKTWLQCECDRWGLMQEESHSTPALLTSGGPAAGHSAVSLGMIPEHSLLESCARLSVSLEGPGIFNVPSHSGSSSSRSSRSGSHHMTMDELRAVNRYAESTKSLSYLPQVRECLIPSSSHVNTQAKVHERQKKRMQTRSEWFLGARGGSLELNSDHLRPPSSTPLPELIGALGHGTMVGGIGLSVSAESVHHSKRPSRRGFHRSSSRRTKGKENGTRGSFRKNNNVGGNSEKNARKARAVSFEQPVVTVSTQQPNNRWHEYSISVDQSTGDYNQSTSQFYHHPPQHQFSMHHHHHMQQQQHSFNNSINSLNISNSNCNSDMNDSNSNIQVLANSDRCGGGGGGGGVGEEDWQMLEEQQKQQTFLNHNRHHTAHYKPPRI